MAKNPNDPYAVWASVLGTRSSTVDFVAGVDGYCPTDHETTQQFRYKLIFGGAVGVGVPFYLKPLLKRRSTRGKAGRRSLWDICLKCRNLLPADMAALEEAVKYVPDVVESWKARWGSRLALRLEHLGEIPVLRYVPPEGVVGRASPSLSAEAVPLPPLSELRVTAHRPGWYAVISPTDGGTLWVSEDSVLLPTVW